MLFLCVCVAQRSRTAARQCAIREFLLFGNVAFAEARVTAMQSEKAIYFHQSFYFHLFYLASTFFTYARVHSFPSITRKQIMCSNVFFVLLPSRTYMTCAYA